MTTPLAPTKKPKKNAGGKLNRSVIIQARLSPKLRFIAELIARHQRRTLSSLIEHLLEETAERYQLPLLLSEKAQTDYYLFSTRQTQKVRASEAAERLWSADEADRFAAVALFAPSLLTAEEQAVWEVVTDTPYFWNHFEIHIENPAGQVLDKEWWPLIDYHGFNHERLREQWPLLQAILEGHESLDTFKTLPLPPGQLVEKPAYYPYPLKKVRTDHGA